MIAVEDYNYSVHKRLASQRATLFNVITVTARGIVLDYEIDIRFYIRPNNMQTQSTHLYPNKKLAIAVTTTIHNQS